MNNEASKLLNRSLCVAECYIQILSISPSSRIIAIKTKIESTGALTQPAF